MISSVTEQEAATPSRSPLGPDPARFLRDLEASGRFHRDNAVGRIFHPGAVSLRERVAEDSIHIVMDRGRIKAHVDRYSPVRFTRDGAASYAFWRSAVHNVAGAVTDLRNLPRAQHSADRCPTAGESIEVDADMLAEFMDGSRGGIDTATVAIDRLCQRLLPDADDRDQRASFNLVDEIVQLLDTREEPWSVQLEVRVAGRMDENRLRQALTQAVQRHPLARARAAPSRRAWNRNYWETPHDLDLDPLAVSDGADDATVAAMRARLHSNPVPLSQSPPLRALLVRRADGDILMLTINHTAMDGVGAMRVLRSIARAYAGDPDPLPEVDLRAARDLMGSHAAAGVSIRARRYFALLERLRELLAPPARLARHGGHARPGYGFHHVRLTTEETQDLSTLEHAGTVNDLLVAALHLATAAWNARHRVPCRRITVLVPANLRPAGHRGELVGNFTLPARVSTTPRQRTVPAATLAAVTAQTSRKKHSGLGTSLLELLSWSWLMPLWLKRAVISTFDQRFTDTAALSNLGRIDDPPSFGADVGSIVEAWFSAPARMPLGLSIGAVTLGGRLHLVFRYRHPQFGHDAARDFAESYRSQLRRMARSATAARRPGAHSEAAGA